MKKLQLLALGLAILTFTACSDDDDDAKTLRYSDTSTDFKVWVGSDEGGKEISSQLQLEDVFDEVYLEQVTDFEQFVKSATITFISDNRLSISYLGLTITQEYKFEGGALSYYDEEDEEWWILGYGDKNSLTVKGGILSVVYDSGSGSAYEEERHFTLEEGLDDLGISSLSEMTRTGDTLAIYNVSMTMK